MVILKGFLTASLRLDLDVELDRHHQEGGSFLWREYEDTEHFKLGQLRTVGLINMISIHIHTCDT